MLNISLAAEPIFYIGSWPVTNAVLQAFVVLVALTIIAVLLKKKLAMVPGMLQNIAEMVIEGALGLMDSVLGSRKESEKYLPLTFTIFIFILISNWSGLIPGVGSVTLGRGADAIPLLRSPASDLNFTLALALIAVTMVNVFATSIVGLRERVSVFFNFSSPIKFFVGILELISEFARIISFTFRLFGNVFAGEVLLAIMALLVPYLVPLPFMFLEVFVGFIQAFIFGMLTLVFVALAITPHEGEEAGH
ncbi:MAG TPA: F0F1 ATP synthase subunit A [Candidatus Paceibacterota bacterium]|nr:F0F1 ATP synthase subunit A [Candidatus Paceibacterota bacterium]